MRKLTNGPSLGEEAGLAAGSVAMTPGSAWSRNLSDWQSSGGSRLWLAAGAGLGVLACLAVAAAVVQRLSASSGDVSCRAADDCNARAVALASAPEPTHDDLVLAVRLFQQSCALGHAVACNNLGLAYQNGNGVAADPESARDAFQKACSAGFGDGCNNEGVLYEHGIGLPANLGDAHRLYYQACRRGSALGCSNLGALYASGRGVVADDAEAIRFFTEACNLGSATGCTNLYEAEARAATPRPQP